MKNPAVWLDMGARLSHITSVAVMMGTMAARIVQRQAVTPGYPISARYGTLFNAWIRSAILARSAYPGRKSLARMIPFRSRMKMPGYGRPLAFISQTSCGSPGGVTGDADLYYESGLVDGAAAVPAQEFRELRQAALFVGAEVVMDMPAQVILAEIVAILRAGADDGI